MNIEINSLEKRDDYFSRDNRKIIVSFFACRIGGKQSTKKNQKIKPKKKTQKARITTPEKKTQKFWENHPKIKYTFQKILPMPDLADS